MDFLAPFSPAFGLAVADILGAILGRLFLASFLALPDFFFLGLSDSEAEDAELRVVLAMGAAFVLGRLEGAFLGFFLDFSSELLEAEEAELFEDFFDLEESWELEESESLELSSLPDEDDDEDPDDELLEDELPEDAEEEALLDPARFGGILKLERPQRRSKSRLFIFWREPVVSEKKSIFGRFSIWQKGKLAVWATLADLSAIRTKAHQMALLLSTPFRAPSLASYLKFPTLKNQNWEKLVKTHGEIA